MSHRNFILMFQTGHPLMVVLIQNELSETSAVKHTLHDFLFLLWSLDILFKLNCPNGKKAEWKKQSLVTG